MAACTEEPAAFRIAFYSKQIRERGVTFGENCLWREGDLLERRFLNWNVLVTLDLVRIKDLDF